VIQGKNKSFRFWPTWRPILKADEKIRKKAEVKKCKIHEYVSTCKTLNLSSLHEMKGGEQHKMMMYVAMYRGEEEKLFPNRLSGHTSSAG